MSFLMPLFIATTIFGVGIIVIDLFGVLSHFDTSHNDTSGDIDTSHDAGHITDGHDGHIDDFHSDSDDSGHPDADDGNDSVDNDHDSTSKVFHDPVQKTNPLITVLSVLRSAVYFSAGFGPVGLFMQFMKKGVFESLLWSLISGTVIMGMTIFVKRLIPKQTIDSQLTDNDILLARGKVIVSIEPGKMGKVRLIFDGFYSDRFAVSKDKSLHLVSGDKIRVLEVKEDAVVVDLEKNFEDEML